MRRKQNRHPFPILEDFHNRPRAEQDLIVLNVIVPALVKAWGTPFPPANPPLLTAKADSASHTYFLDP